MVQHIGSKFSLPKNLPVLSVAVGRSRGFSDPPRSHAQDGSQPSWNARLCHTLLHPPPHPPQPNFLFLFSRPLICLCTEILWIIAQRRLSEGNKIWRQKKKEIATVQFEGCTTKQTCSNEAFKFNRIINAGRKLSFNLRHIRSSEIITHLRIFTLHCQDLNKENIDWMLKDLNEWLFLINKLNT